jgi:hypothetical protein
MTLYENSMALVWKMTTFGMELIQIYTRLQGNDLEMSDFHTEWYENDLGMSGFCITLSE